MRGDRVERRRVVVEVDVLDENVGRELDEQLARLRIRSRGGGEAQGNPEGGRCDEPGDGLHPDSPTSDPGSLIR
jgi:hypothetical protein